MARTQECWFHRLQSGSFAQDPQPDLPECFRNPGKMAESIGHRHPPKKNGKRLQFAAFFVNFWIDCVLHRWP
jgi:hypothetical protein